MLVLLVGFAAAFADTQLPKAVNVYHVPPPPSPTTSPSGTAPSLQQMMRAMQGGAAPAPEAAHSAKPETPPSPVAADDDSAAKEVMKGQGDYAKEVGKITELDPFSENFKGAPGASPSGSPDFEQNPKVAAALKMLADPRVQAYMKLFQDEKFVNSAMVIVQHPKRMEMLYTEVGVFIFLLFLGAWRKSRAKNWIQKASIAITDWVLMTGACGFLVPWLFLGEDYMTFMKGMLGVFKQLKQ